MISAGFYRRIRYFYNLAILAVTVYLTGWSQPSGFFMVLLRSKFTIKIEWFCSCSGSPPVVGLYCRCEGANHRQTFFFNNQKTYDNETVNASENLHLYYYRNNFAYCLHPLLV